MTRAPLRRRSPLTEATIRVDYGAPAATVPAEGYLRVDYGAPAATVPAEGYLRVDDGAPAAAPVRVDEDCRAATTLPPAPGPDLRAIAPGGACFFSITLTYW